MLKIALKIENKKSNIMETFYKGVLFRQLKLFESYQLDNSNNASKKSL